TRIVLPSCFSQCPSLTLNSFLFNDPATTEIYTLSLHDALPIFGGADRDAIGHEVNGVLELLVELRHVVERVHLPVHLDDVPKLRSEEHTSELQSLTNIVCRLLLEKKKPDRIDASPWSAARTSIS